MLSRVSLIFVFLEVWSCSSSRSEAQLQAEFSVFVERNNGCAAPSECTVVSPGCPLGCEAAVNVSRANATMAKARELIDEYESAGRGCEYGCLAPTPPVCVAGHCRLPIPGDGGCTLIGCGPAVSVRFQKASAWTAGTYRVLVEVDGTAVQCSAAFPLSCSAPVPCDNPDVTLLLEGCALPSDQQSLGGIQIGQATPASVSITVQLAGQTITQGQWSPQYTTSYPNGVECGPACRSAPEETLVVP